MIHVKLYVMLENQIDFFGTFLPLKRRHSLRESICDHIISCWTMSFIISVLLEGDSLSGGSRIVIVQGVQPG